jgi:predicted amidophosphoribosyltransferase
MNLCTVCYRTIEPRVRQHEIDGSKFWAGAQYGEQFAKVILLAKEQNNSPARDFLADLIVQTFIAASAEFDTKNSIFIPIPSSRSTNRVRGFRHALLLSRVAGKKIEKMIGTKIEVRELLEVNRKIADQSNLSKAERLRNLSGAYSINNLKKGCVSDLRNHSVFLIDDLVTTGSSTREGLRALHEAGFSPRGVLSAGVSAGVSTGAFS